MAGDENIAALQEALDICGFDPGSHDGMMGPSTRKAIRAFQKSAGIDVDGDVGPQTQAALAKALDAQAARAKHLAGFFEGGGRSIEQDM